MAAKFSMIIGVPAVASPGSTRRGRSGYPIGVEILMNQEGPDRETRSEVSEQQNHGASSRLINMLRLYPAAHRIDNATLPRVSHSRHRNRACRSSTGMNGGSR